MLVCGDGIVLRRDEEHTGDLIEMFQTSAATLLQIFIQVGRLITSGWRMKIIAKNAT